jgi:hypothetical protein
MYYEVTDLWLQWRQVDKEASLSAVFPMGQIMEMLAVSKEPLTCTNKALGMGVANAAMLRSHIPEAATERPSMYPNFIYTNLLQDRVSGSSFYLFIFLQLL